MKDCIFCKIIKKEVSASKLYEDKHAFAFLDISPANKGHTLVIPKKHYETIDKIPEKELGKVMNTVQKIAKALDKISDGVNIVQNNKSAAGQLVPHLHFHIIPRYKDDGIRYIYGKGKKYKDKKEEKQYQDNIKKLLN